MTNPHTKHSDRFPSRTETIDGRRRKVRLVTCDKCGYPARLLENTANPLPPEMLRKKFTARGWSLGGSNVCPRCQQGKKPMAPAARRAAYCAMRGVSEHKPESTAMTSAPAAQRIPSGEERRRIRDALDDHYDEDAARYRQSFSDKALAAKLDLPAKWITDLREAGGYGPDQNEAAAARSGEIDAVRDELAKLQGDLLARFDSLERRVKRLALDDGRIE